MTHSLTLVAGLGLLMSTSAMAQQQPTASQDALQTEIAPDTSIQPLGTPTSQSPHFVLLNGATATSTEQAEVPTEMTVGTSGLLAFGTEGIRMPVFERDIPTGSVTPKR